MQKKMLVGVAAAVILSASTTFASGVGIVDMKKIFTTSPKVKQIKSELKHQFSPEKAKLDKMGKALQASLQNYQKNKAVMSKKDVATLQAKIAKQEMAFRQAQAGFQQTVFKAQNKQLGAFMSNVKAAVKKIAEKEKLDLVLPKNDVLYVKSDSDITGKVLSEMK